MVFYDHNIKMYKYYLIRFEHKLMEITNYQEVLIVNSFKLIKAYNKIMKEIDFAYGYRGNEFFSKTEEILENETYIIMFILYRIKALYSRTKLKTMMSQVEKLEKN